ncbi:hypothetical protein ORJ04_02985 [Rheinheimera baltica]|uniref:Methyl-accepting chemotaxis protein n=2 Tax=Rheinheimera baltica TaxID=67576 RepID=A0ABT9HUV9_9GAMM|nr:hypothetical protein [Rheinheimera baltica]MDP5134909.1 hypothetical protein [Rheinheimera baltica]
MRKVSLRPALFVLIFTLLQAASYALTSSIILPLVLGASLLLVFSYWPRQPELIITDNKDENLAQTADNITQATSTMAIGAAEVSFFIDSLIKEIKLSSEDSRNIAGVSEKLANAGSGLNNALQSIGNNLQSTACAS